MATTTELSRLRTALRRLFHPNNKPRVTDGSKYSLLSQEPFHSTTPAKVPKGHVAVYVGPEQRRYLIPAKYLSSPEFSILLEGAAEEFGFQLQGGLKLPCEEYEFEEILMLCGGKKRREK